MIAKRANEARRATWASAKGVRDEDLERAEEQAKEEAAMLGVIFRKRRGRPKEVDG